MTEARPLRALAPHLVWELLLLLLAGGVVAGLLHSNSQAFNHGGPWATTAVLGFAATGLALSLRTATPNLAIGPLAVAAGYIFASRTHDGMGTALAFTLAVVAAAAIGLVMGLFTGLTALPGWAVTLIAGSLITAVTFEITDAATVAVPREAAGTDSAGLWVAVFVAVSVLGAVLFAVPAVRRSLSANRPGSQFPVEAAADPARWAPAKLLGALAGLTGSSLLAGVAGVLAAQRLYSASPIDGQFTYALIAVVLGGVSVFGRRAGIFGVVLGVLVVDLVRRWELLEGATSMTVLITACVLGVVGLLANWLLELIGRRLTPAVAAPGAPFPPAAGGQFGPAVGGPFGPAVGGGFGAPPVPGFEGPVFGQPTQPVPGSPVSPAYGHGAVPSQPAYGRPPAGEPVSGPPGYSPAPPQPAHGQPPAGHPVSGPPGYSPVSGGPPVSGPPGYSPAPPQPAHGQPAAGDPVSGPPGYSPVPGGPQVSGPPGYPGANIPQPWSVPGADTNPPQVPAQPTSPPVSGPPHSGPPPAYPQTPPPSWPPRP